MSCMSYAWQVDRTLTCEVHKPDPLLSRQDFGCKNGFGWVSLRSLVLYMNYYMIVI